MLSSQLAHEPHGWLLSALAGSSGATKTTTSGADAKRLAALEKRIKRLEDRRAGGARTALRAARAATDCVATRWVPDDYYGRSMRDRSKLLNCDVRQMCKSMLLENKNWRGDDPFALNVTDVHTYTSSAWPYKGRYPCGSLAVGGNATTPPTWFYGTYYLDNQNDTSTAGTTGPNPGPNCDK